MSSTQPRLVSYDDTMHQLGGISRTTLHQLIVQNKLTRASIGRRSFVTQESIDRYIDSIAALAE